MLLPSHGENAGSNPAGTATKKTRGYGLNRSPFFFTCDSLIPALIP